MSRTVAATSVWCFEVSVIALGFLTKVLAEGDAPAAFPPVMRNVLIWDQDESGHMVDVKRAKALNANVINVAAVPHGVGSWIGSVKPLEAYKAGLKKAWKADLDQLNKAGI